MNHLVPNPDNFNGTYLIQQLDVPGRPNLFSFGGGGSGLTQSAEALLAKLWSWRYMGAAEYEFGAAQRAMAALVEFARRELLEARVLTVEGPIAENRNGYYYASNTKSKKAKTSVFVIACRNHFNDIQNVLTSLLNDTEYVNRKGDKMKVRLKTSIRLWDVLFHPNDYWGEKRFGGGLDLCDGWLVFTDETMFRNTCTFFEIPIPEDAIKSRVQHVPPKIAFSDEMVDRKITRVFASGVTHDLSSLLKSVYDISYKVGDVVASEHLSLITQVEKRIAVLLRKKILTRDRKTKILTKVS